mmetsp:Transcript_16327/g.24738  ORF Transcript_16327/g.24738 Transcript_16327/m.24738 type:complete len:90 (+) Transcript_16327:257-526(+)
MLAVWQSKKKSGIVAKPLNATWLPRVDFTLWHWNSVHVQPRLLESGCQDWILLSAIATLLMFNQGCQSQFEIFGCIKSKVIPPLLILQE